MKKFICMALVLLLTTGGVVNAAEKQDAVTDVVADGSKTDKEYTVDYNNASDFEKALNEGEEVKGKIVIFDVKEYKPNSLLGINCYSGEHLNFISEEELDVKKGDIITGEITKKPKKIIGSWKISYKALNIESNRQKTKNTEKSEEKNKDTKKKIIVMPERSDYFTGADWTKDSLTDYLKKLGFKDIEAISREPSESNYEKNIFSVYVCTGIFDHENSWEKREKIKARQKIKFFYNEKPMLTVDNCADLDAVLNNEVESYDEFTEKYDEWYVEFKADVTQNFYSELSGRSIVVVSGACRSIILNEAFDGKIDTSVNEGDQVIIRGKINGRKSKLYNGIYVDTLVLEKV